MLNWIKVKSSHIVAYFYDKEKKELYVKFLNDIIYKYEEVPEAIVLAFSMSVSKGAYFERSIKHSYLYERINDEK